ncbi:MAG: cell division protein ZapE [Micrococcales bacterium]
MATNPEFISLVGRFPEPSVERLLGDLVPPREFELASFKNYVPHQEFPSQASVSKIAADFASGKIARRGLFSKAETPKVGIYLDGGFGVGKTHLLASTFHTFRGKKAFGSFIAFTSLIGALTFPKAVEALSRYDLICIDEFELDDPGDTMMMSRLLNELSAKGTKFAATSNTPPNALGEGRFAAEDFQREIHGISNQFQMLRIDGEDHRHRPVEVSSGTYTESQIIEWLAGSANSALEDFDLFLKHLGKIHPSKYGLLLEGVDRVGFTDVHLLKDQAVALRFVSFVDRAYEQQVAIRGTGVSTTEVFTPEHIAGGYRKKYLRAVSRLGALAG